MRKYMWFGSVLCAGAVLLCGCGKQETNSPVELQTGWLEPGELTEGEPYTQEIASNYEMADESATPPAVTYASYENAAGAVFQYDPAGRLRSYTAAANTTAPAEPTQDETALRAVCDEVLASYIPDYAEYTEIASQYYLDGGETYNLAMEHVIADGIADYALIRLDTEGNVHDLSISYADEDGDSTEKNFITDEDKAYFEEQAQPYLTALEDYPSEVTYTHYKRLDGKLYAFYEITYTDSGTGLTAGQKLLTFVK